MTENIAWQYRASGFAADELARVLVQRWQESPPHRRNMLDPDVVDTGMAVAQSASTARWYAVQMFGRPRSAQLVFRLTNEAGTTVRYRLGDETFDLPPGVTRTHERCTSSVLALRPGEQPEMRVTPRNEERYVVAQDASGRWRLERQ